jgi:hypothetical protein
VLLIGGFVVYLYGEPARSITKPVRSTAISAHIVAAQLCECSHIGDLLETGIRLGQQSDHRGARPMLWECLLPEPLSFEHLEVWTILEKRGLAISLSAATFLAKQPCSRRVHYL